MHYRPQIDGLRAIAVILVIFAHSWDRVPGLGHLGVRLFFVISGYLITGILMQSELLRSPVAALKAFYARRCLRIMPAYYAGLALFCIVSAEVLRQLPWHLFFATNIRIALDADWGPPLTRHFWSLGVEEQFYLLWPIALIALRGRWLPVVAGLLIVGGLGWRWVAWSEGYAVTSFMSLLPAQVGALGAGIVLWWCENRWPAWDGVRRFMPVVLPVSLAAMGLVTLPWSEEFRAVGLDTLMLLPMFLLVAAAASGPPGWTGSALSSRPALAIGRISYGLYVYHTLAIVWGLSVVALLPAVLRERGSTLFVIAVLVATAFAWASYRWIEAPMLRFKDRVPYPKARAV